MREHEGPSYPDWKVYVNWAHAATCLVLFVVAARSGNGLAAVAFMVAAGTSFVLALALIELWYVRAKLATEVWYAAELKRIIEDYVGGGGEQDA